MVDPFVPAITALLMKDPRLKSTVLAERVGFNHGVSTSVFRARVAEIKAQLGVVDPADRLVFNPGEQAQCDLWFPSTPIADTGLIHPVLTMVACWSRFLLAVMIPSRQCGDILAGMNILLGRLGGLPDRLLWDNETGLVNRRRLIPQASGWAGAIGASIKLAKPADPETKGRIERANGYLDSSFEPARDFASIDHFNAQLSDWLDHKANRRRVRAIGARPIDLLEDERNSLNPLPMTLPEAAISVTVRLSRDYHLRIAGNDYSIDPSAIGRLVTVKATLTTIEALCGKQIVASHRRCLSRHRTITDPIHVQIADRLRQQFQNRAKPECLPPAPVEQRDPGWYDRLWQQEVA
jgi:hypothetical protein